MPDWNMAFILARSRLPSASSRSKKSSKRGRNRKQGSKSVTIKNGDTLSEIAARHGTTVKKLRKLNGISAILYIAVDCMREMLLEGKKIRLGDLGDFSLLLTSKGAEDADKFTAQNITGVKVQWEPGQEFKNLRDDAEFMHA